jgi:hypothetical protein
VIESDSEDDSDYQTAGLPMADWIHQDGDDRLIYMGLRLFNMIIELGRYAQLSWWVSFE